ncbi:hypothetical protein KC734_17550 [candidate division KSB1 bacterium]|nr:hypothetical protein [candidate division KSB1 bacterium]
MKWQYLVIFAWLAVSFSFADGQEAGPGSKRSNYSLLSINKFTSWVRADGIFSRTPKDSMGTVFPRGQVPIIYSDAFIWGGKAWLDSAESQPAPFRQTVRVGGATYRSSTQPGRIIGFGAGAVPADTLASESRVYRIRRDYFALDEAELRREAIAYFELGYDPGAATPEQVGAIREMYARDWIEWPVQYGAPFIDRNGNGLYDPPPSFSDSFSPADLVTGGYDEPGITAADTNVPADQVLWAVYNDLDEAKTRSFAGSRPLGLEMQLTQWTYRSDAEWGAIFYRKVKFINKGGIEIDTLGNKGAFWLNDMYFAQWVDPDLGSFADDVVGCDTTLNLGYVYNSTTLDSEFQKYNLAPAAVGYMILQGPVVRNPNRSAVINFKKISGWQNLPMTAFICHASGDSWSEPPSVDNYDWATFVWYKLLRGYTPMQDTRFYYYPSPAGIKPGPIVLAGDPVSGEGHLDASYQYWPWTPSERRFQVHSGPFAIALGDTQEVVLAFVAGMGNNHLSSVQVMKYLARQVQFNYPNHYVIPSQKTEPTEPAELPFDYLLAQNYPNPFNASTRIDFSLPKDAEVRLAIFDVLGREIVVLLERSLVAGTHSALWDGRDVAGKNVPSGHYFYMLQAGHIELSRGLTLIR